MQFENDMVRAHGNPQKGFVLYAKREFWPQSVGDSIGSLTWHPGAGGYIAELADDLRVVFLVPICEILQQLPEGRS